MGCLPPALRAGLADVISRTLPPALPNLFLSRAVGIGQNPSGDPFRPRGAVIAPETTSPAAAVLEARDLHRHYQRAGHEIRAVDGVSLTVAPGEMLAVVGASGSGKSTLLNLLAGLDTPTAGTVSYGGCSLGGLSRRELAAYRARRVGMVFQSFNLLPHLTALQNVALALTFLPGRPRERRDRAVAMLARLGLGERLEHRPLDLSGGEQQRVAIARALVKEPEVLFADEPTGNLDAESAAAIGSILAGCRRDGLTVVLVTHDAELAASLAPRRLRMHYGRIADETAAGAGAPEPSPSSRPADSRGPSPGGPK
jgi:putative ABC transport system ATP-binding protein